MVTIDLSLALSAVLPLAEARAAHLAHTGAAAGCPWTIRAKAAVAFANAVLNGEPKETIDALRRDYRTKLRAVSMLRLATAPLKQDRIGA